jgi:DNA invertase Pin-like site-specific DNA recombinase
MTHADAVRHTTCDVVALGLLTPAEAAREAGVPLITVHRWLDAAKVPRPRQPVVTAATRQKALDRVRAGHSQTATAARYGVSVSAVRRWCAQAGVRSTYGWRGGRAPAP